jgi:endonuclease YncB( thermonuclease family)
MIRSLSLAFFLALATPAMAGETAEGTVVGIIDGDTIDVLHRNKPNRIRLHGIDCPEKRQDFGTQAKQLASDLAFGKAVSVERVADDRRTGRTVAVVTLPDGRILNHELVKAGLAWWDPKYAPRDTKLRSLEDEARAEKRGLWSHPTPIPPWEFRKTKGKVPAAVLARCADYTAEAAQACAERGNGCSLGPPLWCSGVRGPPPNPNAPCACVCAQERELCSMVPSARR